MAVRSLTEIWIDANFKETQLADLRIGHRVRCEVDMYGGRREFRAESPVSRWGPVRPCPCSRHRTPPATS